MSVWEIKYNDGGKGRLVSKISGKSISERSCTDQAIKRCYEESQGKGSFDNVATATYLIGIPKELVEMTKGVYGSREKLRNKLLEIKRITKSKTMDTLIHSI
jgi:hypothetical protein